MSSIQIPTNATLQTIRRDVSGAMKSRFFCNMVTETYEKKICAICDTFITVDNCESTISAVNLAKYCERTQGKVTDALQFFPELLVRDYANQHSTLSKYVLSPALRIVRLPNVEGEQVIVCSKCHFAYTKDMASYGGEMTRKAIPPPPRAIWNGNMVGETPQELLDLNVAEIALVSPNRILCHGMVVYADQHRGVYGWHALYENNVGANIGNINQLIDAGLKGEIVCVLCGPFTRAQKAVVRDQTNVRYEKLVAAFNWLKLHNHFFNDLVIPAPGEIKSPVLLYNNDL